MNRISSILHSTWELVEGVFFILFAIILSFLVGVVLIALLAVSVPILSASAIFVGLPYAGIAYILGKATK